MQKNNQTLQTPFRWREHLWWVASLFLVGLGAKLWLIFRCGTPLPFMDQWDGEAATVFIPYFEGKLTFLDLFRAHNEHRIFFTRVYDLGLLLLNGQWDNQLEMVGNAILHSATLAAFGAWMAQLLGTQNWRFIWLPLALALVLPFAWENTLGGFQVQFYFLLVFSLLNLGLMALSRPLSVGWWLGVLAGAAALFTGASGFLSAATVMSLAFLDILLEPKSWRRQAPTLAVCVLLIASGLWLKALAPQPYYPFQVRSAHAFFTSLGRNLAWPWIVLQWYALFNCLPIFLFGWVYLRSARARTVGPADRMILILGGWALLQSLAVAYARGGSGKDLPSWRYMDSSSFLMIVNWLAIVRLMTFYREQLPWLKRCHSGFALWILACLMGLGLLTQRVWTKDIPERMVCQREYVANARAFLVANDVRVIEGKPSTELPFPDPYKLADWLSNPHVRRILPDCVRDLVQPSSHATGWLSIWAARLTAAWAYVVAAGLVCLGLAFTITPKTPK